MSYRCVRRFAAVVVFAALGLALLPAPADADSPAQPRLVSAITAQQSSATGDLAWSFSRRYIFADERVATAFAILIDEPQVIEAAGLEGQGLVYSDDEIRAAAEGQPVESAEVLLAAGGVAAPRGTSQFEQARRCRIWTPPAAASAETEAIADALGAALVTAFARIGIAIDPCEASLSAVEADLFVAPAGLEVDDPSLNTNADGFLGFRDTRPAASGGSSSAPAQGGNAGTATTEGGSIAVVLLMISLASFTLFGGRRSTGARRR